MTGTTRVEQIKRRIVCAQGWEEVDVRHVSHPRHGTRRISDAYEIVELHRNAVVPPRSVLEAEFITGNRPLR